MRGGGAPKGGLVQVSKKSWSQGHGGRVQLSSWALHFGGCMCAAPAAASSGLFSSTPEASLLRWRVGRAGPWIFLFNVPKPVACMVCVCMCRSPRPATPCCVARAAHCSPSSVNFTTRWRRSPGAARHSLQVCGERAGCTVVVLWYCCSDAWGWVAMPGGHCRPGCPGPCILLPSAPLRPTETAHRMLLLFPCALLQTWSMWLGV